MLWSFGVVVETVLMLFAGERLVRRLGPMWMMGLGTIGGILRWSWLALDPVGISLWLVQSLHAVSFAMAHLGAIAFIATAVPERFSASAQGATGAMAAGVSSAIITFIAAAMYPQFGGLTYLLATAASIAGLVFVLLLARRWRGEQLAI